MKLCSSDNHDSKNYLNISMEPLFQPFLVPSFFAEPVIFCLNLSEAL